MTLALTLFVAVVVGGSLSVFAYATRKEEEPDRVDVVKRMKAITRH